MATQWKSQRLNMTIKSLDQIRAPVHKLRFPQVLVGTGILAMLVMRPAPVCALSCGDTITASTTLASDLGPCSGTALTIGASNVTLKLAGFSVIGPSTCGTGSIGVFVPGSSVSDKIEGPGTITGFDQGIHLGTPGAPTVTQGTLVRHVHLTSNGCVGMGTGITMQGSSGNIIKNNTLSANPCIGIFIDNGAPAIRCSETRLPGQIRPQRPCAPQTLGVEA